MIFDATSNQTSQIFHSDSISQETLGYSGKLTEYSFDQSPRGAGIHDLPLRHTHEKLHLGSLQTSRHIFTIGIYTKYSLHSLFTGKISFSFQPVKLRAFTGLNAG